MSKVKKIIFDVISRLEILKQKVGWITAVGLNTAKLGSVFNEPGFHGGAIEQVELKAEGKMTAEEYAEAKQAFRQGAGFWWCPQGQEGW